MMERLYYEGGKVLEGMPPPAERFGVVCIAQPNQEHGRQVITGSDFYYRRDGVWYGADLIGLCDQITANLGEIDCVAIGRMIDREQYNEILTRAASEDGLPRETARYAEDARPR